MKRAIQKLKLIILFLLPSFGGVGGGFFCSCENQHTGDRMRFMLDSLQKENQAYTTFTSDSLQLELCRYFDRWGNSNERMKAYYLLGRAYHDMGEVPHALEIYQQAAEIADTTREDCDYKILSRVYGQMADLFFLQNLADEGKEANDRYIHYAWLARDTMAALYGYIQKSVPYYILRDTDRVITETNKAIEVCEKYNYPYTSAAYATNIRILLSRKQYRDARKLMDKFEASTDLFDKNHEIVHGRELHYYTIGLYQLGIDSIDSAEIYFRKSIPAGYWELSFKGLYMVYEKMGITDSISKYAKLYVEEHDRAIDENNTATLKKISSIYKYDSYRHKADVIEKRNAGQRVWILFLILCVLFLCFSIITISYINHAKNIKRKLRIERLKNEYLRVQQNYNTLSKEYNLLQLKELEAKSTLKKDYEQKLTEKKQELDLLKEKIEKLGATLKGVQSNDNLIILSGEAIVVRLRKCQRNTPNENDWEELRLAYKHFCPAYYSFITNCHSFSVRNQLICLLLPLDFTTKELSVLFSVSQQSITNAKQKICKLLFVECSSNELNNRLKTVIMEGQCQNFY